MGEESVTEAGELENDILDLEFIGGVKNVTVSLSKEISKTFLFFPSQNQWNNTLQIE